MKPAPFEYAVATSIDHAIALCSADEEAKFIAGGQSLLPLLNLRFASPTLLVDISRIAELRSVQKIDDKLIIGALTRHVDIERNPVIQEALPLLSAAAGWVAHPQIRNRGTLGGSVAHSDTAAEFPAVLLATGATIVARSAEGERRIASEDFFGSHFQNTLEHGELLVAVEFPLADEQTRWGFSEFARRKGDYAIGGAAVSARLDERGKCVSVGAGLVAAGSGPTVAQGLDQLIGLSVDETAVADAVTTVTRSLNPGATTHGTNAYRRAVVAESLRRALHQAFDLTGTDERKTA